VLDTTRAAATDDLGDSLDYVTVGESWSRSSATGATT
jgi:dihydroneopterin aldolase